MTAAAPSLCPTCGCTPTIAAWNTRAAVGELALNVRHPKGHEAADAFWTYWRANGEAHVHGYYESTWGAINAAIRLVGVVPHTYTAPRAALQADPVAVARLAENAWKAVRPFVVNDYRDEAMTALDEVIADYTAPTTDALPAAVPAGFVLVPVEPDELMQSKGAYIVSGVTREGAAATYRAMLAAAPKPTDEAPPKGFVVDDATIERVCEAYFQALPSSDDHVPNPVAMRAALTELSP